MAKRQPRQAADVPEITRALQRQIDNIRTPFMAYARQFVPIAAQRATLAPRFMAVYRSWREAMGAGTSGSFVAFVRHVDANVPADRDGYRAHPTYLAADYLRRLTSGRRDNEQRQNGPSQLIQFARLLAAVLPVIQNTQAVWQAVERELGITGRRLTNLQALVTQTRPLMRIPVARPVTAQVIHMAAEQPRQAGRRAAAAA